MLVKQTNKYVTGVPGENKKRGNSGREKVIEEIAVKCFLNWTKIIHSQIQEAQGNTST